MKWLILIWTIFCLYNCMSGMAQIGDMEAMSEAEKAGVGLGWAVGWVIWFLLWCVFAIPAYIIGRMFGSRKSVVVKSESKTTLCSSCGKYYEGIASFCPLCGVATGPQAPEKA